MIHESRAKIIKLCFNYLNISNRIFCNGRLNRIASVGKISTSTFNSRKTLTPSEALKENNYFFRNQKDDGDTFGNIENLDLRFDSVEDDAEDIEEYKRSKSAKGKSMSYYISKIDKLLRNNEYQEALKLLEEEMVKDQKPILSYVYRLFLSYNAKTGNIKESYRLYTNYKKRNGKVMGAMYTSLFNACANCPNSFLALEKAELIREFMKNDKNHSVNLSNYNAMLKAYGRHGDLPTCLKIVDEVLEKRDKVKTETYNFLLQACASDRNSGLRHALITWRKMLQNRCAPTVYEFNTVLRCVRDCFLGDVELLNDFVESLKLESGIFFRRKVLMYTKNGIKKRKILKIPVTNDEAKNKLLLPKSNIDNESSPTNASDKSDIKVNDSDVLILNSENNNLVSEMEHLNNNKDLDKSTLDNTFEESNETGKKEILCNNNAEMPNLLSLTPTVGSVISFGRMIKPHERLLCLGGLEGFLKTMDEFGVEPNMKTFTLLLSVVAPTREAEEKVMAEAKARNLKLDTVFFNVLIKRRTLRESNFSFQEILKEMQLAEVAPDIVTFGSLALGCITHESGIELIKAVRQSGMRLNSEILGGLLKLADRAADMHYVKTILEAAKEDQTTLSIKFIGNLGRLVKREKLKRRRAALNKLEEKEEKDLQLCAS